MARITMTQTFDISAATAKALLAAAKQGKPASATFSWNLTLPQIAQLSTTIGSTAQINAVFAPIGSDIKVSHG